MTSSTRWARIRTSRRRRCVPCARRTGRRRLDYTREELAFGAAWRLGDSWRVYGEAGYGHFLLQYLTFQDFPGEAWGGEEEIVWTWNHLWYLVYLWVYTLALVMLQPLLAWLRRALAARRLAG